MPYKKHALQHAQGSTCRPLHTPCNILWPIGMVQRGQEAQDLYSRIQVQPNDWPISKPEFPPRCRTGPQRSEIGASIFLEIVPALKKPNHKLQKRISNRQHIRRVAERGDLPNPSSSSQLWSIWYHRRECHILADPWRTVGSQTTEAASIRWRQSGSSELGLGKPRVCSWW